jgi:hypothetical protein
MNENIDDLLEPGFMAPELIAAYEQKNLPNGPTLREANEKYKFETVNYNRLHSWKNSSGLHVVVWYLLAGLIASLYLAKVDVKFPTDFFIATPIIVCGYVHAILFVRVNHKRRTESVIQWAQYLKIIQDFRIAVTAINPGSQFVTCYSKKSIRELQVNMATEILYAQDKCKFLNGHKDQFTREIEELTWKIENWESRLASAISWAKSFDLVFPKRELFASARTHLNEFKKP